MAQAVPLWQRAAAWLYLPAVLLVYGLLAARALRPLGSTWAQRVRAALARRESAALFDSARVLAFAAWMGNTPDLDLVVGYLRRGVPWCPGYGIFQWVDVLAVPPSTVVALVWVYRAALLLVIAGSFARAAAAVAALCHVTMWSIAFSTAHGSVHNHAVFMILLSVALSPEPLVPLRRYIDARRRRRPLAEVGSYPAYLRFAAMFTVATVYVQTGVEKFAVGGPRWFNGTTLQAYMLRKDAFSLEVAKLPLGVFMALGVFVVLWETWYGLIFFERRLRPFAVLSAWAFHEWVRWGMNVWPFFFMEAAALFVFTPYEAIAWVQSRRAASPRAIESTPAETPAERPVPPAGLLSWRLALLATLLIAQWIPTGLRKGVYPFLSNAMFSSSLAGGELMVGGARIVLHDGAEPEREVQPETVVSIRIQRWNELVFEHYLSRFQGHAAFAAARPDFCRTLLKETVEHSDPRATRVELWMDHFNAGQMGMRTQRVADCTLEAEPRPAAPR